MMTNLRNSRAVKSMKKLIHKLNLAKEVMTNHHHQYIQAKKDRGLKLKINTSLAIQINKIIQCQIQV